MPFTSAEVASLDWVSAIDRSPLTVAPECPVLEVIEQMGQHSSAHPDGAPDRSCALVLESGQVQGIFTERDIVRLSADEADLSTQTVRDVMVSPVHTVNLLSLSDVFAVLFLFRRHKIRHLPVIDEQGRLSGIVSQASLRSVLRPANLLKLQRVGDVMSTHVISASPQSSVLRVTKLMAQHRVSCVVLVEKISDNRLSPVGIITERDIVQFQTLRFDLGTLSAQEMMSSPLILLEPEDSLWHANQEMKRHRIRRLVVSWNWGRNLGLVTQTSLLRAFDPMEMYNIIESLQQTIQQLEAKNLALQQQANL
ncbi:MAG: CBS domain-containing protein [Cyanobacteria bacterium P01_F01_bin.42]